MSIAVTSAVKQALQESLVQILQPKRRVDVLRDVMESQRLRRPYVITFCGVNGVGKSTNLAKVSEFFLVADGVHTLGGVADEAPETWFGYLLILIGKICHSDISSPTRRSPSG